MERMEFLIKKWELLWNHYKLQDEMQERRRYLLWLIQVFVFTSWYYTINNKNIFTIKFLNLFIPIFGIFINVVLLILLRRHKRSLFLTEQALRDVEEQMASSNDELKFDRFILDKKIFSDGENHSWPHSSETIEKECCPKLQSPSFWMNKIVPWFFIILWIVIGLMNILRICEKIPM